MLPPDSLSGIQDPGTVYTNLSTAELVEHAVRRGEGDIASSGAITAVTAPYTGRVPKHRFLVAHGDSKERIDWGQVNQPVEPDLFDALHAKARKFLSGKDLFVVDAYVGADPEHQIKLRVISEFAWHALFCKQLFRRPTQEELLTFEPEFEILNAGAMMTDPEVDGTNGDVFVGLDLDRKRVLIAGTRYAGEMKKSIFSAANYLMPVDGVLSMHCSANMSHDGDVALFFGLSGTGKTTLSADPERHLIGDDETGWGDNGIFNFEGGCYAKCIDLSEEREPQIWASIRFGTVLENVVLDPVTRDARYEDDSITENTRAAYPLEFIPGYVAGGRGGHASTIVFLTADAFGVLPPIAKLNREAAMYHFLSGFTAKLAGTEAGVTDPEATFSTCFGAPFIPLAPSVYAEMLGERIDKHNVEVYLVNTGWTGGPFGVGKRMSLPHTREMVKAATSGRLRHVETKRDPIFNLDVPVECPGVPAEVLDPKSTWSDPDAYDEQARALAAMFVKNFERFVDSVPPEVTAAGPSPE